MSIIGRLIEDIRGTGRQVETTTAELFEHFEERLSKLESKVLGKDAPKAPEPKPAPVEQVKAPEPPPVPLDKSALAPTPGPAPDPKALAKASIEQKAMQDIASQGVQTTTVAGDPAGSKAPNAPSMAPVPLPNTDADHPAREGDPMKSGPLAP